MPTSYIWGGVRWGWVGAITSLHLRTYFNIIFMCLRHTLGAEFVGGFAGAITFLHLRCISSSWCYVTRASLDFSELCHRYGKTKVWGGPVTWKKCANSWRGYRKLHLRRTVSMVLTAFLTSIQCEVVQNHHRLVIVKVAINARRLTGAGTLFMSPTRSWQHRPETEPFQNRDWHCRFKPITFP